jgi:hypothetical protein
MNVDQNNTMRIAIPRRSAQTAIVVIFVFYAVAQATIIWMQAVPTPPLSQTIEGILIGFLNGVLFASLSILSALTLLARRGIRAT